MRKMQKEKLQEKVTKGEKLRKKNFAINFRKPKVINREKCKKMQKKLQKSDKRWGNVKKIRQKLQKSDKRRKNAKNAKIHFVVCQ